jgi:hypothetical protein
VALCAVNTITRKAVEIRGGLVTDTLIKATEPARIQACYRRAVAAYEGLSAGKSVEDIVMDLDVERQGVVEARANAMFSGMAGKDIKIHVSRICGGARREGHMVERYLAFDCLADVEMSVDGQSFVLEGVVHEIIPQVAQGQREDIAWCIPMVAAVLDELYLAGNTIINITIPAAVAAAMGVMSPAEAAVAAEKGAIITAGIPGTRPRAETVATMALDAMA